MQMINIDGTTYTLKFDKCPIEWAKLARKAWKPKKPKDIRKFPVYIGQTTAQYVRQFEQRNFLVAGEYFPRLNVTGTALYDPSIPLLEDLSDDTTN